MRALVSLCRLLLLLQIAVVAPSILASPARAAEPVDLLLVLAADVSSSVKEPEFRLQRTGYAKAFLEPRVISAIRATPTGRIAVIFVEWSGPLTQKVVVDWTLVDGEAAARRLSDRIMAAPRAFSKKSTSISAAIDFSLMQFASAPFRATRRIVDLSGDGDNNSGRPVTVARDVAMSQGVTINGLVIVAPADNAGRPSHSTPEGGLANYYRENVIGGPGAFVIEAQGYHSFGAALIHKLVREIAFAAP